MELSWAGLGRTGKLNLPLHTNRQFITTGNSLDSDILLRHTSRQELLLCASDKRVDDFLIPSRVHNCDAQASSYIHRKQSVGVLRCGAVRGAK